MAGQLAGVRVLDLSRVLAGPWASQIMADYGADVIKVERPQGGDDTRKWGPPWIEDKDTGEIVDAAYFAACNRGKRSVSIDLAQEKGQALVRRLVEQSDIVLENYKVGGLARYGLDYPSLKGAMSADIPDSFKVRKQNLLDIMQRATTFAGADRAPALQCFLGKEQFAVMMTNDETGLLGDRLDLPGQLVHDRIKVIFTPKNIMEPLEKSPSDEVEIFYNSQNNRSPWKVDGGSGFTAWMMPRREITPQED